MGSLDFAGGTVVHANAGAAALAMAVLLGRRRGWPENQARPHNLPMVMFGTALLWLGWFGFNGGSALAADGVAAAALFNTSVAAAAAMLAWVAVERVRFRKPTTLDAVSGAVSGLVAITPGVAVVLSSVASSSGSTCRTATAGPSWPAASGFPRCTTPTTTWSGGCTHRGTDEPRAAPRGTGPHHERHRFRSRTPRLRQPDRHGGGSGRHGTDLTPPKLAAVNMPTSDEIGELASAFNRIQATAWILMERQVTTRRNSAVMFSTGFR